MDRLTAEFVEELEVHCADEQGHKMAYTIGGVKGRLRSGDYLEAEAQMKALYDALGWRWS